MSLKSDTADVADDLEDEGPWGSWEVDGVRLSPEQREAVSDILTQDDPVTILTGLAGAGKSLVIKFLTPLVTITATTGKAAINVGGITLDALFCFNRETGEQWAKPEYLDMLMHQSKDIILIDEASMISRVMMDAVVRVADRYAKRLVLVGDWGQASPVVPNLQDLQRYNKDTEMLWPIEVPEFTEARVIKLTECHRQSDADFLQALNDVRSGACNFDTSELFRQRVLDDAHHPFFDAQCLRMFATNKGADDYNRRKLMELVSTHQVTPEKLEVRFETLRRKEYDTRAIQQYCKQSPLAHGVDICVGARVLFVRNENPVHVRRYVNGDTGRILSIKVDEHGLPKALKVELDRTGKSIVVERITLVSALPSGQELYALTGFPLRLGWAMTIHKTQGMTTDYAWVNFASLRAMQHAGGQAALHGLAYVALSRCRSAEGLYLASWDPTLIWSDPKVRYLL